MGFWELMIIGMQLVIFLGVPVAIVVAGVWAFRRIARRLDHIEMELKEIHSQINSLIDQES